MLFFTNRELKAYRLAEYEFLANDFITCEDLEKNQSPLIDRALERAFEWIWKDDIPERVKEDAQCVLLNIYYKKLVSYNLDVENMKQQNVFAERSFYPERLVIDKHNAYLKTLGLEMDSLIKRLDNYEISLANCEDVSDYEPIQIVTLKTGDVSFEEEGIQGKKTEKKSRKPRLEKLVLPSDKLTGTLMGGNNYIEQYTGEICDLNIGQNKDATIQILSDNYNEILEPEDRLLLEDILSVYLQDGEQEITFARILEARTGKKVKAKMYRSKIEDIIARVDHLRNVDITYSETNHTGFTTKVKGHPLNAIIIETDDPEQMHLGGARLIGSIEEAMPFFNYALEHKQVATMPKKLIPQTINSNDDNAIIYRYLYRHIEKLKNKKNKFSNNVLTFERIHQELRKEPTRVEAKRIRDTVERILEEWKAQGYITAYTFNKKGQAYYSITITK